MLYSWQNSTQEWADFLSRVRAGYASPSIVLLIKSGTRRPTVPVGSGMERSHHGTSQYSQVTHSRQRYNNVLHHLAEVEYHVTRLSGKKVFHMFECVVITCCTSSSAAIQYRTSGNARKMAIRLVVLQHCTIRLAVLQQKVIRVAVLHRKVIRLAVLQKRLYV